jgi:dolichyl-phosphate-mannose-protein mannosyltransferase
MTTTERGIAQATAAEGSSLRDRILPMTPGSRLWGWAGPLAVTLLGGFLRFYRLSVPHAVVFDETYYAKDAYSILNYGYEHRLVYHVNRSMLRGNTHIFAPGAGFVVHPPLGKVFIAAGEAMFGLNPFGWRFAAALIGTLSILLTARIARRMTRSTLLGTIAGLLLALDGLEFVMSRIAMLDIFVMFWTLATFGCMVVDRDSGRARLAERVDYALAEDVPKLGIRWWRIAAGACLGLACASKWNAVYYAPAFVGLAVVWDSGARRAAGVRALARGAMLRETIRSAVLMAVAATVTYVGSFSGWLFTSGGWDRNYAAQHGIKIPGVSALVSLYEWHKQAFDFHIGLDVPHQYASQAWTWLLVVRPVAFYYRSSTAGSAGCKAASCSSEVLAIGTPVVWWGACAAIIVLTAWWLVHRDWRAGAILLAIGAGWLPWFLFISRTKFYFYAVMFDPYLVMALALCLGLVLGPAAASARRRAARAAVAGTYILYVALNFIYLYPLLTAQVIPHSSWMTRMWFSSWI